MPVLIKIGNENWSWVKKKKGEKMDDAREKVGRERRKKEREREREEAGGKKTRKKESAKARGGRTGFSHFCDTNNYILSDSTRGLENAMRSLASAFKEKYVTDRS